jgi:hypothetical protein
MAECVRRDLEEGASSVDDPVGRAEIDRQRSTGQDNPVPNIALLLRSCGAQRKKRREICLSF